MRPQHASHKLHGFPVYSSSFISPSRVVLGGGGGQSKTGVKNRLRIYDVSPGDLHFNLVDEYELEEGADVPMSMSADLTDNHVICGANASEQSMHKGRNMHCRAFGIRNDKIEHLKSVQAMNSMNNDTYQRVTVFSQMHNVVAVGTTANEVHLLHYPSLNRAAVVMEISAGDVYDCDFSATSIAIASSTNIFIYNLHEDQAPTENLLKAKNLASGATTPVESVKGKGKGAKKSKGSSTPTEGLLEGLELSATIVRPKLPGNGSASTSFRAVRYHPKNWMTFYAVLNSTLVSGRKTSRKSHVLKYEWSPRLRTWKIATTRKIGEGAITCFEISADGKLVAYSASDNSIGILDSQRLAPLMKILGAHELPSTTLRFSTDRSLLLSGSADTSVRVITVPEKFAERGSRAFTMLVAVALIAALVALLFQLYVQGYLGSITPSSTVTAPSATPEAST